MQIYYQIPVGLTDEFIWPNYPSQSLVNLNAGLMLGLSLEPDRGGPIARFIGYKLLGRPRSTRVEAQAMLPLEPGDPSPFFDAFDDITKETAASAERTYALGSDGTPDPLAPAICGPSARPDWCTPERLMLLYLAGGRAYWIKPENALPVFFRVTEVLDEQVPESFPNRIDKNGEPHTWRTWGVFGNSHAPVQIGEHWYRSSAYGEGGVHLEIEQWISFYQAGGAVLSRFDYEAVQRAGQLE